MANGQPGPYYSQGEFDFGFAVDWMRKDLRICMEEADRNEHRYLSQKLLRGIMLN